MKITKWILTCTLAVSMTAATIWAQKGVPDSTSKQSVELDMLVDIAEMDLLADMLESLLREEENADSSSISDFQMPESSFANMPGMDNDIYGSGFGVDDMGGFGGFPIMVGFNGMNGFGNMGGFSGYPMMGGFGGMGVFCGF